MMRQEYIILSLLALMTASFAADVQDYYDYYYKDPELKAKKFERPRRDISLIVTSEGFYPKSISVFKGERIKLFVTAVTDKPSCLTLPSYNVFLAAQKGRMTETEIVVDRPGRFKFYCPADNFKGHLTVIEKKDIKRDVANDRKPVRKIWMPREY